MNIRRQVVDKLLEIVAIDDEMRNSIIYSLTEQQNKGLREYLEIDRLDVTGLRILRNQLVYFISEDEKDFISHEMEGTENDMLDRIKLISIVTAIIDNKIYALGGEI